MSLRKLVRSLSEAVEDADFEVLPSSYCDICFESIWTEDMASHNGMALKFCQHWFCRACWQHHVTTRIRQGDLEITCPVSRSICSQITNQCNECCRI